MPERIVLKQRMSVLFPVPLGSGILLSPNESAIDVEFNLDEPPVPRCWSLQSFTEVEQEILESVLLVVDDALKPRCLICHRVQRSWDASIKKQSVVSSGGR